jgi:hypothetical protein
MKLAISGESSLIISSFMIKDKYFYSVIDWDKGAPLAANL